MKPTIFLMLVFFCSSITFGQKYVPFPTENAEWNVVLDYSPEYFQQVHEITLLRYTLHGDTIVDNVSYQKICLIKGTSENPVYIGVGGLRESNRQIFYVGQGYLYDASLSNQQRVKKIAGCDYSVATSNDFEVLLYDFNVHEGDQVQWGYSGGIIEKIDSILIGQTYRKTYRFKYSNELVIEGVGNVNSGLFGSVTSFPMCGGSWRWENVCFSQNGESMYKNPAYKECNSTQKWSDINSLKTNTQWYYGEIDYPFYTSTIQYDNYNSLKSIGDTIINNIKCNILSQVRGNAGCASYENITFAYQSNDTVFFYNSSTKKFSTLYVYGAKKGDSWTIAYPLGDVSVMVDSMGTVEALGQTLKIQYVTYSTVLQTTNGYSEKSKIIENIGDVNYFFQSSLFQHSDWTCDEFGKTRTGLRCYVHPDLGTFSQGTLACDSVTTTLYNTEYKPLLNYNNKWNILHSSCCPDINKYNLTEVMKLSEDTVVSGVLYKKLISAYDSLASQFTTIGYLREDRITNKVYYKLKNKNEFLLYDFDVKPNDTINIPDFRSDDSFTYNNIVLSVDSVLIGGVFRKRITLNSQRADDHAGNEFDNQVWIEGIGGMKGLLTSFYPMMPGGEIINLLCFSKNDSLFFKNEVYGFDNCFYWQPVNTRINEINGNFDLEVYPNPTYTIFSFKSTSLTSTCTVEIMNITGAVVLRTEVDANHNYVNLSDFENGLYLYRLISNGKLLKTGKVLKL